MIGMLDGETRRENYQAHVGTSLRFRLLEQHLSREHFSFSRFLLSLLLLSHRVGHLLTAKIKISVKLSHSKGHPPKVGSAAIFPRKGVSSMFRLVVVQSQLPAKTEIIYPVQI